MTKREATFAVTLFLSACSQPISKPRDVTVAPVTSRSVPNDVSQVGGWGGFPLSETSTSLWLTYGAPVNGAPQPLVMVYYVGSPGWHNRDWKIDSQFGQTPAWIRLISSGLTLAIEYSGGNTAKIQGQTVELGNSNVFLVSRIDGPLMGMVVKPLGKYAQPVPTDATPGEFILRTNPEIQKQVHP